MSAMAAPPNRARGYGLGGASHLKSRMQAAGAAKEGATVVPRSEVDRIRKLMEIDSQAEKKQRQVNEKNRLMELSAARKDKITAIDKERSRFGGHQNPEEIEQEQKRLRDIKAARKLQDEGRDEVKAMNKVVNYSKCVTIRDAQVDEKRQIEAVKQTGERKLDMMMEMERLKALKMYEEREKKRVEDRRKGAMVIRAQIEEREQDRLRHVALKQQEQEAMLKHIDKMREEDKVEAERKVAASKRLMEDVALANAEQIRLKTRQRETEREEERRITEYLREKERREQELQEEQERIRHEKERETARLRALQEKAQDKQAELDALRAKRAQEAYEREWRRKEKEEAQRVARINRELSEARETQKREKEALLAEQAMIEAEEFDRVIAVQRQDDRTEEGKRRTERERRNKHQSELKAQMMAAEEKKKKEKQAFFEEGHKLKKERELHEAKLESIRQEKLQQMEEQGVPAKYRQELARLKNIEPLRPSK